MTAEEARVFKNFHRYRVPARVKIHSLQVPVFGPMSGASLDDLGVKEVYHFGSFAAGEMLRGMDNQGREVSFLVDRWTPEWVAFHEITLDQFASISGAGFKVRIPGREIALMFGFDPEKCRVVVNEHGMLTITQEGCYTTFSAMTGFWEEVKVA